MCELEENKETILIDGGCTSHEHNESTTYAVDDHLEIDEILDMDNGVTTDGCSSSCEASTDGILSYNGVSI